MATGKACEIAANDSASYTKASVQVDLHGWLSEVSTRHRMCAQGSADALREFVRAVRGEGHLRCGCTAPPTVSEEGIREFVGAITSIREVDWNPADHPRRGTAPNPGWFAATGGGRDAGVREPLRMLTHDERAKRRKRDFRTESDPTPPRPLAADSARSTRRSTGISIDARRPTTPFRPIGFSLQADDAARVKAAIEALGVPVARSDKDGAATLTLRGKPTTYAWDVTNGDLLRAVVQGMLASQQDLNYASAQAFVEDARLLQHSAEFSRTRFQFLAGELPELGSFFNENADLKPNVSPAEAVRSVYEHSNEVRMACRNCMQFAVLRALVEVYGDEKFDEAINSYRDPSKPFDILDSQLFDDSGAPLMRWTDSDDVEDIVPGQWVYALGNRESGALPGYEGSNFIVQPGPYYRSPWRGGATLSLADHLVDTFLYWFRWSDWHKDGLGRPSWSQWDNDDPDPKRRELVPIDRNAGDAARIRDFLLRTPAGPGSMRIGGLVVPGILQSYRGTPRLRKNPRPERKLNP